MWIRLGDTRLTSIELFDDVGAIDARTPIPPPKRALFQATISDRHLGPLRHRHPVFYAGTLLHPRVPSLKCVASRWHRQLHEPGKDQTADNGDVSYREDLTGDERLLSQDSVEVVHTPQGFVTLTEPPLGAAVARRYWEDTAAGLEATLAETADPARCLHQYPEIFRKSLESENRLCLSSFMAAEYEDLPEAVKKEVARLPWNRCPLWRGIGATLPWNTHVVERYRRFESCPLHSLEITLEALSAPIIPSNLLHRVSSNLPQLVFICEVGISIVVTKAQGSTKKKGGVSSTT